MQYIVLARAYVVYIYVRVFACYMFVMYVCMYWSCMRVGRAGLAPTPQMRNAARLGGLAREYGLFLGGRVGDERACGVERRAVVRRVTVFDVWVRRMSIDPE